MRSAPLVVAVVVAVGGLLLAGCGSQHGGGHSSGAATALQPAAAEPTSTAAIPPTTPAPTAASANAVRIEVTVNDGQVETAQKLVDVPLGSPVVLVVTSDMADRVHVHGYDKEADLTPGQATSVPFEATIPGVFEVELHHSGKQLVRLRVR